MIEPPITELEVSRILSQPMEIADNVIWHKKQNDSWLEALLRVKHPQRGVSLEMRLQVNDLERSKYSFSLLLWGAHRIRGLDVRGSHENHHTDSNRWIQDLHKHKWTDNCRGSWAYSPDKFPVGSMEETFKAFCEECGIKFIGKMANLPTIQRTFFEEV